LVVGATMQRGNTFWVYEYRKDKIQQVWSVIDKPAVERQL
jgi:predicted ester cyclase